MNAVVELPKSGIVQHTGRMAVAEVVQHAMVVQEVMQAVMKEGLHFGKIPGAGDKPVLFKAGAEKLCMVFKIGDDYRIEDLSTADLVRYRVTCIGRHTPTGTDLGQGIGECSSSEEKYRWRKAICKEEFEATPQTLRRSKFARGKGGSHYTQDQVRTEPADLANTVLKMAGKRAKIAMVLNVLAVSDMFGQDLDELSQELREHLAGEDAETNEPPAQAGPPVWPKAAFDAQFPRWSKAVDAGIKTADEILALAHSKGSLTAEQEAAIRALKPAAKPPVDEPPAGQPAEERDSFVDDMNAAEKAAEAQA